MPHTTPSPRLPDDAWDFVPDEDAADDARSAEEAAMHVVRTGRADLEARVAPAAPRAQFFDDEEPDVPGTRVAETAEGEIELSELLVAEHYLFEDDAESDADEESR